MFLVSLSNLLCFIYKFVTEAPPINENLLVFRRKKIGNFDALENTLIK